MRLRVARKVLRREFAARRELGRRFMAWYGSASRYRYKTVLAAMDRYPAWKWPTAGWAG